MLNPGAAPLKTTSIAISGKSPAAKANLAGAKDEFEQSLTIWQKSGDQGSAAFAMSSLRKVLLDEADFSGARKT